MTFIRISSRFGAEELPSDQTRSSAALPDSDRNCRAWPRPAAGVEGSTRASITGRDVVEQDHVGGTFRIVTVFEIHGCVHGCGDPAHARLDLRDQQTKVRGGVSAKFSMDILRPLQLGALPLLVR